MILPTADFDPLFAEDGVPFEVKMARYIEREFADLLGGRAALLRQPGGLDVLARLYGLPDADADRKAA